MWVKKLYHEGPRKPSVPTRLCDIVQTTLGIQLDILLSMEGQSEQKEHFLILINDFLISINDFLILIINFII